MRRELIFYDFSGRVLGRCGDISSLYVKEYYNAVGTFEAHFPASSEAGKILLSNEFVVVLGDGFKDIITSVTAGGSEVTAYGRSLGWILIKRLCAPFGINDDDNIISEEAALIAERLVSESWSGCITVNPSGITGHKIEFSRSGHNPCGTVIIDALAAAGLGHKVDFSPKGGWSFTVYEGKERRLTLGRDLKNATKSVYTQDILDRFNVAYVDGDLTHSTDITDWETQVDNAADIASKGTKRSITAEAVNLVHGIDYNLGDIIRVTEDFCGLRFSSKLRVAGVERWAEYNDVGEKPILEAIE